MIVSFRRIGCSWACLSFQRVLIAMPMLAGEQIPLEMERVQRRDGCSLWRDRLRPRPNASQTSTIDALFNDVLSSTADDYSPATSTDSPAMKTTVAKKLVKITVKKEPVTKTTMMKKQMKTERAAAPTMTQEPVKNELVQSTPASTDPAQQEPVRNELVQNPPANTDPALFWSKAASMQGMQAARPASMQGMQAARQTGVHKKITETGSYEKYFRGKARAARETERYEKCLKAKARAARETERYEKFLKAKARVALEKERAEFRRARERAITSGKPLKICPAPEAYKLIQKAKKEKDREDAAHACKARLNKLMFQLESGESLLSIGNVIVVDSTWRTQKCFADGANLASRTPSPQQVSAVSSPSSLQGSGTGDSRGSSRQVSPAEAQAVVSVLRSSAPAANVTLSADMDDGALEQFLPDMPSGPSPLSRLCSVPPDSSGQVDRGAWRVHNGFLTAMEMSCQRRVF